MEEKCKLFSLPKNATSAEGRQPNTSLILHRSIAAAWPRTSGQNALSAMAAGTKKNGHVSGVKVQPNA